MRRLRAALLCVCGAALVRAATGANDTRAADAYRPLILFRDSFFGRTFVKTDYTFEDCPAKCEVTWDVLREPEATAVWFFNAWAARVNELPDVRAYPNAYWVWAASEAPSTWLHGAATSPGILPVPAKVDRLFNVSMTFQLNSDVLLSYGSVVPLPAAADAAAGAAAAAAHSAQVASWFASKQRVAAWTVSHCYTVSRREEYAARLREHVTVDIYGKCAGVWGKVLGLGHAHQMDMLRREYKLYLAFENRLCRDYITEKFWIDALLNGAIPVVRGGLSGDDYAAVAPPGSYINADDFASPEALAAHMLAVAGNATLFAQYHAWRLTHRLTADSQLNWAHSKQAETAGTCRLCEWLHAARLAPPPPRTLNVTGFWSGAASCRAPTDLPHIKMAVTHPWTGT